MRDDFNRKFYLTDYSTTDLATVQRPVHNVHKVSRSIKKATSSAFAKQHQRAHDIGKINIIFLIFVLASLISNFRGYSHEITISVKFSD